MHVDPRMSGSLAPSLVHFSELWAKFPMPSLVMPLDAVPDEAAASAATSQQPTKPHARKRTRPAAESESIADLLPPMLELGFECS